MPREQGRKRRASRRAGDSPPEAHSGGSSSTARTSSEGLVPFYMTPGVNARAPRRQDFISAVVVDRYMASSFLRFIMERGWKLEDYDSTLLMVRGKEVVGWID